MLKDCQEGEPEKELHWWSRFCPPLQREDRIALVEGLAEGSEWSMSFGVMLGTSVIIAGLGLLQGSVAVIIGAMLVAPLMTPLIGAGLALVQGNFKLLKTAAKSMWIGVLVGLALGAILQVTTPGNELSTEVLSRGNPNILDLQIAFFAGVAAGYATARPKMSGALPGVAISVALVPPLAAAGIALGAADLGICLGALLLFITNLVAIVLGSAMVFRLHGIKVPEKRQNAQTYMKRVLVSLGCALVLLMAPLIHRYFQQIHFGQAKPASLALSEELWNQLHDRVEKEPGVDFLSAVRPMSKGREDLLVLLTSDGPVRGKLVLDLEELIDEQLGESMAVKFSIVQQSAVLGLEEALEIQETVEKAQAEAKEEARMPVQNRPDKGDGKPEEKDETEKPVVND